MRASSSWIKLQFVVRKHVMNTYQMHTLSPSFYSITLSLPVSPSLFHVFGFFCLSDSTSCHSLSGFLMLCPTEVTYSQLCCIMCSFICACVGYVHMHIFWYLEYVICVLCCVCVQLLYCYSSQKTFMHCGKLFANLSICFDSAFYGVSHLMIGLCGDVLICRL